MCIVFFKKNPTKGIKRVIVFNRDEQPSRKRSSLGIYFDPQKIACGVDLHANGTWLGINLDTGNYGFLTNYENVPFKIIDDTNYKKGNLLMNFLKSDEQFLEIEQYEKYLDLFLKEGSKFNGTNIWLANIYNNDEIIFAHN